MYIYYCDKCKTFESFMGVSEEFKCKDCGNDLLSLGVTIDDWNNMSEEDMMKTINYATEELERKSKIVDYSAMKDDVPKDKPNVRVNLMVCPECFKEVAKSAVNCPYCKHFFENNPQAVKKRVKDRKLGIILSAVGAVLLIISVLLIIFLMGKTTIPVLKYGGFVLGAFGIALLAFGVFKLIKSKPPKMDPSEEGEAEIDMVMG